MEAFIFIHVCVDSSQTSVLEHHRPFHSYINVHSHSNTNTATVIDQLTVTKTLACPSVNAGLNFLAILRESLSGSSLSHDLHDQICFNQLITIIKSRNLRNLKCSFRLLNFIIFVDRGCDRQTKTLRSLPKHIHYLTPRVP